MNREELAEALHELVVVRVRFNGNRQSGPFGGSWLALPDDFKNLWREEADRLSTHFNLYLTEE